MVEKDYTHESRGAECFICGLKFPHFHKKGTMPKDFERIEGQGEEEFNKYNIRNEDIEETMKDVGSLIGKLLPKEWGFMLMIFDFSKKEGGNTFYISNAQRADMVKHMREMADKMETSDE